MSKSRSAEATIKGFIYQFAASIRLILESDGHSPVTLEGIEDVDVSGDGGLSAVQCKYYEGTKLTNSVLREIVQPMLEDNSSRNPKIDYYLYGHFKDANEFPLNSAAEFRNEILSYRIGKGDDIQARNVADDLGISTQQIAHFLGRFHLRFTERYDTHKSNVIGMLQQSVGCTLDEANLFYYPNAFTLVADVSTRDTVVGRTITKSEFLSQIDSKHIVFHQWLRQERDDATYCRTMRRRFFTRSNISPFARFFVVSTAGTDELHSLKSIVLLLRNKWSSHSRRRLAPRDRYAPYILLREVPADVMGTLKTQLFKEGVGLVDGFPFAGSPFSPEHLGQDQTQENGISLRFVSNEQELKDAVEAETRTCEIYEFYRDNPLPADFGVKHIQIPISRTSLVEDII